MPKSSHTHLEDALKLARRDLPGWAYATIRSGTEVPAPVDVQKTEPKIVPSIGPEGAPVAFIGASPERVDGARGEPFVGPAGETLRDLYLKPLGLEASAVVKSNAVPVVLTDDRGRARQPTAEETAEWSEWITKELTRLKPRCVIAMGQTAKKALGDLADFVLPHPMAIRKYGDKGEVGRKLRRIRKALEQQPVTRIEIPIVKADDEKQIVYGVVLSSYGKTGAEQDSQNDWSPPSDIERTAHEWFAKSRKIGISHPGEPGFKASSDSDPVESHVEKYPTDEDYKAAMANLPHKVNRRPFGTGVVHSGDWVVGTKLGDESWAAFKRGEVNAYSVEGFGERDKSSPSIMPKVTFIDMKPAAGE